MKLGEKIKQLRKSKGISQEELASTLKINRNFLSRIETGKSEPTASMLKNIAKIFNVDLNSLLDVKSLPSDNSNKLKYITDNCKYLDEKDIEYKDFGCQDEETVDYPDIAEKVAKAVQTKEYEQGILICRSGIGMSICANKFKGIRCALCHNEYTAKYSRLHNDSNILAMGADDLTTSEAILVLRMWLATEFEGGRHLERVKLIEEIENRNMK